ncbi:RNA polymerase sigma factor ShbA [Amycolatopsis sp. NPDC004625]|uniref:RNA polymerase sigma factor ShbA n=1 Tax=Amycolatopsis sp. NPDC004625 TaxID=3154670 RepID=UPI0033ABDFB0
MAESVVDGYTVLEDSPRPEGALTKEQLNPIVAAAHAGDPDAVQSLLRLIKPTVVRYCRARVGGRNQSWLSADDVADEVCLAVLKVLPNYQDRGGSFLYLVRAIAANKVADAFRSVTRDRSKPVPELPDRTRSGNEPETHVHDLDLRPRLGRLLESLPPLHREILSLRLIVGLSANETAEALGISAGNVRITQYRALTKLRATIRDSGL